MRKLWVPAIPHSCIMLQLIARVTLLWSYSIAVFVVLFLMTFLQTISVSLLGFPSTYFCHLFHRSAFLFKYKLCRWKDSIAFQLSACKGCVSKGIRLAFLDFSFIFFDVCLFSTCNIIRPVSYWYKATAIWDCYVAPSVGWFLRQVDECKFFCQWNSHVWMPTLCMNTLIHLRLSCAKILRSHCWCRCLVCM